jgi:D-alanyl-lipoteichoic acid acyltransferase DltB (MBOAT superfamily)
VEKSLLIYALYVMFYPQLVAGPIERPGHLIPQFKQNHIFDYERVSGGLKRMLWGFFKKIVIADRLAVLVNQIYNQPHEYAGIPLILATWFFTYQIYCDFSAYTDIALGAAQVMGFRLMENFRLPFSATTIIDFWNRWHISLSSWFRDYVYLPLGISAKWHWSLVVLVVFALSGIWHGAGWTFVVWGLLHGIFIIATIITRKYGNRLAILTGLKAHPSIQKSLQIILTFQLVSFAFIFFRAQTLADAWYIVTHLLSHIPTQLQDFMRTLDYTKAWGPLGLDRRELVIAVAAIVLLEEVQHQFETSRITNIFREKPLAIRWGFYYALILGIIFFTSFSSQRFIYFQF